MSADRKVSRLAGIGLALSAIVLWISTRMPWLTVESFDGLAGESTIDLAGAVWSTEATAVVIVLLLATIAAFALRRLGRRLVGIAAAVVSVGVTWQPLSLVAGQPDPERAHQLLSAGAASQRASDPIAISAWAEITSIQVHNTGPALAMLAGALGLVAGIILAMKPGTDPAKLNKYERKSQRTQKLAEELRENPDSGRVMWDALDEDIDPTDPQNAQGSNPA